MFTNHTSVEPSRKWTLRCLIQPGDIGYIVSLHGTLYAQEYGYDQTFEAYVAAGLAEFIQPFNPDLDRLWLAEVEGQVIGSIAVDGHPGAEAQLRWFLIHPTYRNLGLGQALLTEALQFCKEHNYKTVFLWTVKELSAARHLYHSAGFQKTDAITHHIWGKTVTQERYDLPL